MRAVSGIFVFAALSLNFSSAKSHWHTANTNMVLARSVADNWVLSMMSNLGNLGGDLICSTEAGACSCSGSTGSTA
jgi:hypothetical protein